MSTDIERLLNTAADDSDQPLHTDVDEILNRARRSVRRTRYAVVGTSVLTTLAVIGGVTVWSSTWHQSAGPAGTPKNQTITVDRATGKVVDNESGTTAQAPPPVSPVADAEVVRRCKQYDQETLDFYKQYGYNSYDKAGPINPRWKVIVKSGDQDKLQALMLSPDQSIVASCTMERADRITTNGRYSTTQAMPSRLGANDPNDTRQPEAVARGARIPAAGVSTVLVNIDGEKTPRQALVGADGFYTLGYPTWKPMAATGKGTEKVRPGPAIQRIRAYDADGKRIYEWKYQPIPMPTVPQVPANVKIRTQPGIQPTVVLTKDPVTGKPLTVVPVSPLTDEQIRTQCKKADDAYFEGRSHDAGDKRPIDAGRISPDWKVALKVGSDKRFTALLVSPGQNVVAWCYRDGPTSYDYSRSGVQADGTFGDPAKEMFSMWAMVPAGVAQIVVDLPSGPVRAAISNGFYLWGTTGGSEDFKKVRVRGYDADAKLVYDQKISVDAS
ncbi:hypothetical protein ACI2LF_13535 [Kribbella sp. NPDC020789]